MSYANRKFAHCVILWTVDTCCRSPYYKNFDIESSIINIPVSDTFTRWRMTLRYRKSSSRRATTTDDVRFEIKRLLYEGEHRTITHGEYVLTLHSDQTERELGYGLFSLKINDSHICYIDYKKHVDPLPSATFELKLHLVIRLDGVTELLPKCSDPNVEQLSTDLKRLFTSKNNSYDIVFQTGRCSREYLHKGILLNRLKREDLKQKIREATIIDLGIESEREAWRKTFLFLYSADMNISAQRPTSSVYHKALSYGIEPIIAYYEPDYLELHTRTEYEDLEFTWTVTNFLSRIQQRLVSRRITGEASNGIMKLEKTTGDHFLINCEIRLETEMSVCLQIFLKAEASEILVVNDHLVPWAGDKIVISEKKLISDFLAVVNDGCITLKLVVRKSCLQCEADRKKLKYPCIGLSRVVRRPYSNEQNYIQLSDDLMSFYRSSKYFNEDISSPVATYINEGEDYFLRLRNDRMANVLFSATGCYRGVFEPDVIRALLQFVFCAKLGNIVGIEDSFKLIDIATESSFHSLGDALIDNLKKLLTKDNAKEIFSLAKSHKISELTDFLLRKKYLKG